jgi:short chain dehydrogenase
MSSERPELPFPKQKQPMPGLTGEMKPARSWRGELQGLGPSYCKGKKAIITSGDSGIGGAVAIAYAREGVDILVSYLEEHEDAEETNRQVEPAGRKAVLVPGDIQNADHCRKIVDKAVAGLGGIDIFVNNAAHQASFKDIGDISDEEWELTFKVNIHAMFFLTKAAVPHMKPGSAIINTASIKFRCSQSDIARLCHDQGRDPELHRRARAAAGRKGNPRQRRGAGPDLDAADSIDTAGGFGDQLRKAGADEATRPAGRTRDAFVMLADPLSSYVSGATIAVAGGKPIL